MAAEGGVKIDVEAPAAAAAAEVGGGEPVQLHVYDISQGLAKELSAAFLGTSIDGIWHTGVSAFGSEYFFGAGIQRSSSGSSPYGAPERVVDLGRTQVAKARLEAFLEGEEMSGRYMAAPQSTTNNDVPLHCRLTRSAPSSRQAGRQAS